MSVYVDTRWLEPDAKPAAPRRHEEADLQASVMAYLALALPADAIAHHSPGEGLRSKRAQGELKRSGYVTGWPDVEVCYQGRVIFIELKTARGTLSTAQRNTHRRLTYCGATVLCCRSLACVEESLRELGVPLEGLGVMSDLFGVTREEMLREVEREIALRRRVYPRWVEAGKLELDRAERQIAVLEAVAAWLATDALEPAA